MQQRKVHLQWQAQREDAFAAKRRRRHERKLIRDVVMEAASSTPLSGPAEKLVTVAQGAKDKEGDVDMENLILEGGATVVPKELLQGKKRKAQRRILNEIRRLQKLGVKIRKKG